MAVNGDVKNTCDIKANEQQFDFNLEDTDWTFNEMEESPACRLSLNKSVENRGKTDWNQSLQVFHDRSYHSKDDDSSTSDNILNFCESVNLKSIDALQQSLKTIPECPSCEEFSIYEDSSNLIPNIHCEVDFEQTRRRSSFESKQKKTLSEVKQKFRAS